MIIKIARFFIEFPILIFVLGTISFIMGWHITQWPFLISWFGLMVYEVLRLVSLTEKLRYAAITLCVTILSLFMMAYLYDTCYDGPWYHAAVIKALVEGWNPFYQHLLTINDTPYHIDCHIWMSHYAKGIETIEAGIVALTGNLESGKALNLFVLISLLGYVYGFLKDTLPSKRKMTLILLTIVVALNPVVLNQLITYMIDWTGYSLILIGALCLYNYLLKKERRDLITLVLMGFLLPTIKFNIVFWWILFLLGVVVIIWWQCRLFSKRMVITVALSVILGFVIGGFNPYITNIIHKGNPVYPLIGKDKIDIMDIVTPKAILGKNRIYQVNYSLASNPYHNDKKGEEGFHSITISKYNIMSSPLHDNQLGGFGMFFFEASVFLLILFFMVRKKDRWWRSTGIVLLGLYISLFILPSGFLARYVPFFYIFPCLIIFYLFHTQKGKWFTRLTYVGLLLLAIDACINLAGITMLETQLQTQVGYVVKVVANASKEKKVYVNTASCLHYDKMERAGAVLECWGEQEHINTQIDMLGVDIWTSLLPNEFKEEEKPWLMRKVSMFVPGFSEIKN